MKRFWIRFGAMMAVYILIALTSNVVMLNLHPLEYYYTIPGMLMSFAVACGEAAIVWPLSHLYWKKVLNPALMKDLDEECCKIIKEECS